MPYATSRLTLALSLALLAGTATLAGCAEPPVTRTTTTEQSTTTTPRPAVSTTTTTTHVTQHP